ncbi:hypothetical protein ABT213_06155 [Streptomyces sp. NPDC001674]|uniref:hypothetical protein n=1 Tax=Streptomyces sp. NPDC001674 TaxID=3154394 RepID=UPI00331AD11D
MNFKIPSETGERGELVRHFRRTGLEKGYGPADTRIGTVTNCGAVLARVRRQEGLTAAEMTALIGHYWNTVGKTQIKTRHVFFFGFKAASLVADMQKRGLLRPGSQREETKTTKTTKEYWT